MVIQLKLQMDCRVGLRPSRNDKQEKHDALYLLPPYFPAATPDYFFPTHPSYSARGTDRSEALLMQ